jgi:hypothetical protein
VFRDEAGRHGEELYLGWFERWIGWTFEDAAGAGFDAAIEFQPLSRSLRRYVDSGKGVPVGSSGSSGIVRRMVRGWARRRAAVPDRIIDYGDFVEFDLRQDRGQDKIYPGACPSWDNSSRRVGSHAIIFHDSQPDLFGRWVGQKAASFEPFGPEEDFLFINAWNEWAEGNHLEPCQRWGLQYLEALRDALKG